MPPVQQNKQADFFFVFVRKSLQNSLQQMLELSTTFLKISIRSLQCVSYDFANCFWVSVRNSLFSIVFQLPKLRSLFEETLFFKKSRQKSGGVSMEIASVKGHSQQCVHHNTLAEKQLYSLRKRSFRCRPTSDIFAAANTSYVPEICYQLVFLNLILYFLLGLRIVKCLTINGKRFRCEQNECTFCS
jgi:hypothetical protein